MAFWNRRKEEPYRPPPGEPPIILDTDPEWNTPTSQWGRSSSGTAAPVSQPDDDEREPWMQELGDTCARQALEEILREEQLRGQPYSEGERMIKMYARGAELVTQAMDRGYARNQAAAAREEAREHAEQLQRSMDSLENTVTNSSAIGLAHKFWKQHPILAGVVGAVAVHKVKRALDR